MPENSSSPRSRDLRARVVAKLRRGAGIAWLRIGMLIIFDMLMLFLAWQLAVNFSNVFDTSQTFELLARGPIISYPYKDPPKTEFGFQLILLINFGMLAASGHYGTDDKRRSFFRLIKSLTLAQIVFGASTFGSPKFLLSAPLFIASWAFSLLFIVFERLVFHISIINLRRRGRGRQPVFLIGQPGDTQKARAILSKTAQFKICGQADLADREGPSWSETLARIQNLGVREVLVCSWQSIEAPIFLFWDLHNAGIHLRVLPIDLKLPSQWTEVKMIGSFTTIRFRPPPIIGGEFWVKRIFDISLSAIALLFLFPVFLLIGLLIKMDSPGPVFYRQARMGLKGCHFKVWKFRTMVADAEKLQKTLEAKNEMGGGVLFKIKSDPRVTKVGKVLRDYSIDELPQLINVLFGEMSLVGPRPLPLRDAERFTEKHILRQEVLPGITGLWQVSGRSDVGDSEQVFLLDLAYIQNWSISLDFQILLETIRVVLGKEGAY